MNIFYELIAFPEETIHKISRTDLDYSGFIILAVACISGVSGRSLLLGASSKVLINALTWGLAVKVVMYIFLVFLSAAMYHYFAGIFGGSGNPERIFKVLPYSFIPFCFFAPSALILKAFAGPQWWLLTAAVLLMMVLWMVFLQLRMIAYFYGISGNSSMAVIVIPWMIVAGLAVVLPFMAVVNILMLVV
jgi:hypothetical protein